MQPARILLPHPTVAMPPAVLGQWLPWLRRGRHLSPPYLVPSHSFTPVAIESLRSMGEKMLAFLKELSQRVQQRTGEVRAHAYLLQRLSVTIREEMHYLYITGSVGCFFGLDPFYV